MKLDMSNNSVEISPEIHETNPIVILLRWGNQARVWHNDLLLYPRLVHGQCVRIHSSDIDVAAENNAVAVLVQRSLKRLISIAWRAINNIEDHLPRARLKEFVQQQCPHFARPWIWPLHH